MTCSIPNCDRQRFAREWCQKHYTRWLRHGDPITTLPRMDATRLERLFSDMVFAPSGCIIWTGPVSPEGYGRANDESGRTVQPHRWMYRRFVGPIPNDLPLDHVCHTTDPDCAGGPTCLHRRCCSPIHLEPVTSRENWARSQNHAAVVTRTNRCKRGHDLTVHGYVRKDKPGRNCMECQRLRFGRAVSDAR